MLPLLKLIIVKYAKNKKKRLTSNPTVVFFIHAGTYISSCVSAIHYWSHTFNFEYFMDAHEDDGLLSALSTVPGNLNPLASSGTVSIYIVLVAVSRENDTYFRTDL